MRNHITLGGLTAQRGSRTARRAVILTLVISVWGNLATAATSFPADQPRTMDQVIDSVIANENRLSGQLKQYAPLVETYIQKQRPDQDLGYAPAGDKYFLGRADFSDGVTLISLTDKKSKGQKLFLGVENLFSVAFEFLPDGFLQMIFIDTKRFDKQHYKFDYVRREFLGEVRTLVFDVIPLAHTGNGYFFGRIWVEDQDYNVVRFNGSYSGSGYSKFYFNFDSWRVNVQPGLWLPAFVYSEEKDFRYGLTKRLDFKAQTRLWGYNLAHGGQEQELSKIFVETAVQDNTKTANDLSPVQAQRTWDRQAENNVVDRLERIGLMAPKGEVDKVLETVVNNLEVTNNIDIEPDVRCRVMMTSTLESYTVGRTIVLSRGLVDVLPDEASLAAIIAHELSHIILGHRVDSKYAFFDQLLIIDKNTFRHFGFARAQDEEAAANVKAMQLLNDSPYKNQLGNAGLFLNALDARGKQVPNLVSPHLGNRVPMIDGLKSSTPIDAKHNPQTIAALPIGGRIKLDPWNDKLELIRSKPIGTVTEREKMPFEVTPFMPYLSRYGAEGAKPITPNPETRSAEPEEKKKSEK